MKENYAPRGILGHFGTSHDKVYNEKLIAAQKLRDKHANLINTFDTEKENDAFDKEIMDEIDKILKVKVYE